MYCVKYCMKLNMIVLRREFHCTTQLSSQLVSSILESRSHRYSALRATCEPHFAGFPFLDAKHRSRRDKSVSFYRCCQASVTPREQRHRGSTYTIERVHRQFSQRLPRLRPARENHGSRVSIGEHSPRESG